MNKKKFLVLLLALVMVFAAVPVSAVGLELESSLGDDYEVVEDVLEYDYGYGADEDSYSYSEYEYVIVPISEIVTFDTVQNVNSEDVLRSLIAGAPTNGEQLVLNITESFTIGPAIVIPANTDVRIGSDISGGVVLGKPLGNPNRHFSVSGTFTLEDGITLQGHGLTGWTALTDSGEIAPVPDTATWPNGGGISVNAAGRFNMEGGTISDNRGIPHGGGILIQGRAGVPAGESTISGGYIINNVAARLPEGTGNLGQGGGVRVRLDINFTMSGGTVSGNVSGGRAGGISIEENSLATFTGGTISYNIAAGTDGGGVFLMGGSRFILDGGTFRGNEAHRDGDTFEMILPGLFEIRSGNIDGDIRMGIPNGVLVFPPDVWTDGDVEVNDEAVIITNPDGNVVVVDRELGMRVEVDDDGVTVISFPADDDSRTTVTIKPGQDAEVTTDDDGNVTVTLPGEDGNDTIIVIDPGKDISITQDPDTGEITVTLPGGSGEPDTVITLPPGSDINIEENDDSTITITGTDPTVKK